MKLLILVLLTVGTFAEENYAEPEYATKDQSFMQLSEESVGLWDRIDEPLYKPPNGRHRRAVGGHEVVPNSIPWIVHATGIRITPQARFSRTCSGSILNANTVLTAAVCIINFENTEIIAGAHNRMIIEPNQQRRTVPEANYRIHPDISGPVTQLAILIMPKPFILNAKYVTPVRLPTGFEHESFGGEKATFSGWGQTANGAHSGSSVLRAVDVPVISNAECLKSFPLVDDKTLCTSTAQGTGGCLRDIGGPLTVARPGDTRPILIAVNTRQHRCAGVGTIPHEYARITKFLAWIRANQ